MKRILILTCIGSLALGLTAFGAPKQGGKAARKPAAAHVAAPRGGGGHVARQAPRMSRGGAPKMPRGPSVSRSRSAPVASRGGAKMHSRSNVAVQRGGGKNRNAHVATRNSAKVHGRSNVAAQNEKNFNRGNAKAFRNNDGVAAGRGAKAESRMAKANTRAAANANAKFAGRGGSAAAVNDRRAFNSRGPANGVTGATNRTITTANAPIVNNWTGVSGANYTAFRDYRREWHDRSWWDSNYTRIILVSGGWWYWNSGYWYPAWGYDPYYTYYPYDGPIYGYSDLTPDRIIINVQAELQNDGYYAGAVDGVLGPQTRRALAAFQADHGLAVTSAVDEPTLATLGLT